MTADPASHTVPAVIFCREGYFDQYDLLRALRMGGITPIVTARDQRNIAFFSRYCGRKVYFPPGGDEADLDILIKLGTSLGGKPVLYYSTDSDLHFVWTYKEQLEKYFRFLLPPAELMEKLFDKTSFSEFAINHNLPVPQTLILDDPAKLEKVVQSVRYPCIVKPAYRDDWVWDTQEQKLFFGWYKQALRRIDSETQLREFCALLPARSNSIVIQSYIDGPDDTITSFHGYFDENSNCLGSFMGQKIRTYPPGTGGSVYIRTILNDELRTQSINSLHRIGFQGIVKIDYKWDREAGDYKMLEINTRYNLWQVLGAHAGVNLTTIAYDHQVGGKSTEDPRTPYPADVRLLFFKMDLRSYLEGYRKTGEWTLFSYLVSVMRKTHYRVFNLTDPFPALISGGRFVWRVLEHFVKKTK